MNAKTDDSLESRRKRKWIAAYQARAMALDPLSPLDPDDWYAACDSAWELHRNRDPVEAADLYAPDWAVDLASPDPESTRTGNQRLGALRDRSLMLAALARTFPSGVLKDGHQYDHLPEEWRQRVAIDLPTGQIVWRFHVSHWAMFESLPPYTKPIQSWTRQEYEDRLLGLKPLTTSQSSEA